MAAPVVRLQGDRVAHSLGVPLEYVKMDMDVLGLGDFYAPDIAPAGSANVPPDFMTHDAGDQTRRWNGRLNGSATLLPPEFGMAPVARLVPQQPLLPQGAVQKDSPETNQFNQMQITDARNEMMDTYPASESGGDPMFMSDAMDLTEAQDEAELMSGLGTVDVTGTASGIVSGFVSGLTSSQKQANALAAKQMDLQAQLEAQAHDEKMKVLGIVGIGALAIGAVVAFSMYRNRNK